MTNRLLHACLTVALIAALLGAVGGGQAQAQSIAAPVIDNVVAGDQGVTVAWSAPVGVSEASITAYDLRYITTDATDKADANWIKVADAWTEGNLVAIVDGLSNGVSYDLQVRAVMSNTDGDWSDTLVGTPADPGASSSTAAVVVDKLPMAGVLSDSTDVDYYEIVVAERQEYWFRTTGNTDTVGTLFDRYGNLGERDDSLSSTGPRNFLLFGDLRAGTYHVKVHGFDGDTGPYTFEIGAVSDTTGLNDAEPIELGGSAEGIIRLRRQSSDDPDRDYYELEIETATYVSIRSSGYLRDAVGAILDSDGTEIDSNDDGYLWPGYLHFSLRTYLQPGTYYIMVRGLTNDDFGPYTVYAEEAPEPGSTRGDAAPLRLRAAGGGSIEPAGDTDYFQFDLDEHGRIYISMAVDPEVAALVDANMVLLDAYGNVLDLHAYKGSIAHSSAGDIIPVPSLYWIAGTLDAGTYYLRINGSASSDTADYQVILSPDYIYEYLRENCPEPPSGVEDELYGCQWYLDNDGSFAGDAGEDINFADTGDTYQGNGVNVVIVDDGLDYLHDELKDNVDLQKSDSYGDSIDDLLNHSGHGTSVAGIIAARDNSTGVRGIAPRATIFGRGVIGNFTFANVVKAVSQDASTTSISNNSWGYADTPGPQGTWALFDAAIRAAAVEGDGGNGVFFVWAAGNGNDIGDWSPLEEFQTLYEITSVCAVNDEGKRSYYSEQGPNLWVCAPSNDVNKRYAGITTTNSGNLYMDSFGGTSAAAPIVSGVAALVREAGPALTWRDVKLILAQTARKNDTADGGWETGALKLGSDTEHFEFNHEYGFGVVDAAAAVELAETWTNLPERRSATVASSRSAWSIPSARITVSDSIDIVAEIDFVEYVEIETHFDAQRFRDLRVDLVSPSGAVSQLTVPTRSNLGLCPDRQCSLYGSYRFGSARHLGENPNGTWTLRVTDEVPGGTAAEVYSWKLTVYGHLGGPGTAILRHVEPLTESLSVSWDAPANPYASAITGYDVRHIPSDASDKSDSEWTVEDAGTPTSRTYTITGLTDGNSYDVQVRATGDRVGAWSATARGTPGALNSQPFFVDGSATVRAVAETAASGSDVGSAVDARDFEDDTLVYSLGGTDAASFVIDEATGQLKTATALDYETRTSYAVTVSVSDNKADDASADTVVDGVLAVSITVDDVNEPPVVTGPTEVEFEEGSTEAVAELVAVDPEGQSLEWSVGGLDGALFQTPDDGKIAFHALPDYDNPLDADEDNTYHVTVEAFDGANVVQHALIVTVTGIDEPPLLEGDNFAEYHENASGAVIAFKVEEPDHQSVEWSLSGGDGDLFTLARADPDFDLEFDLEFITPPDFEAPGDKNRDNKYLVNVEVSDGNHVATISAEIEVLDVNEPPEITGVASINFAENSAAIVASYNANDPEDSESVSWSLSGTDGGFFEIDHSGDLSFMDPPDHEAARGSTYRPTLTASDGTFTDTFDVVVNVTDVNEPPEITVGPVDPSFDEGKTGVVARYEADDPEGEDITWSLSGTDNGFFEIDSGGRLRFKTPPDFEASRSSTYRLTVRAFDGTLTTALAVAVAVTNVDEAGVLALTSQQPQVGTVLRATLSDPDGGVAGVTWSWESSPHGVVWTAISSAASSSYTPVTADFESYLRVTASYRDRQGSAKSAQAEPSNAVRAAPVSNRAPEFPLAAEMRSVNENAAPGSIIGLPVEAHDPDGDPLRYVLGGTHASFFQIVPESGQLRTLRLLDHEMRASYSVRVTAQDPSGLTDSVGVTIMVADVDEDPVITDPGPVPYAETSTGPVHTFRATDPEEAVVSWSVSGTDGDDFAISGTGVLSFADVPDFEDPTDADGDNVYEVTVVATDDGLNAGTVTVTVTVSDVDEAPVVSGSQSLSLTENQATDRVLGIYSAVDPEDPFGLVTRWSLSGTDAGDFSVSEAGELLFRKVPDFERPADSDRDNVYSLSVGASDGRSYGYLAVTVTVTDVNEAPEIAASSETVFVYRENGTGAVYAFSAVDPERAGVVWSLGGADGVDFEIAGDSSGRGVLWFVDVPDFESPADADGDNVYEVVVVAADDRGLTDSVAVTVTVTNSAGSEEPTITTTGSPSPFRENGTGGVYTFRARDPQGGPVGWTVTGVDSGALGISSGGVLWFVDVPDFERPADADGDNVYEVVVVATDDQGLTDSVAVAVAVSDVDEGPVVSGSQSLSLAENQATDRVLGTYGAVDPEDPFGLVTRWSLSGTDAGDFSVSDTGELSFRKAPDYERPADSNKDNVYSLSVRASDGRNYGYLAVTVTVTDVDEAPEIATVAKTALVYRENGTAVLATFRAVDPEEAVVVWSLSGPDGGHFAIYEGVLTFKRLRDFESPADVDGDNVYEVTVVAADEGLNAGTLAVTVTVSDVDEGPVVSGPQSLSLAENQATDRVLGAYEAVDPEDPFGLVTRWSLSGTDAGDFSVSEAGELSFRKVPDFERPADSDRDNVYSLSVRASDGRNYGYLAVTVTVDDVDEAPEITTTAKTVFAYRENGTAAVFTFSAADPERSAVAWSAGGADSGIFAVASDSRGRGVLSFADPPDFEKPADAGRDNVYEVTVVATDDQGLNAGTLAVTVTVTDVNEGPEVSGPQSLSFTENQATDQILATYDAVDPEDPAGPITRWSLSGTDAGDFSVSDTGELSFRKVPDYERPADSNKDNVYSLSVRASDGRNYGYLAVTVTVTDINEAPEITTTAKTAFAYRENGTAAVYTFSAADPEQAAVAWSAGGADSDDFAVTRDSRGRGVLSFANAPDFESPADADSDNVYEVTVVATDDQGLTDSVAVTVTVTDHGEGPVVAGPQNLSFAENQATDQVLAFYDAVDPEDPSGPITRWSLSGTDAGDFSVSDTGELSFRKAPDYERPADSDRDSVYSLSVRASDGRNYGYLAVTVTVTDVNEAPEITTTAKTAFAYRENGTAAVFTFSAADPEQSAVAWSAGGADSGIFAIASDSRGRGVLSFADPPDFEKPADAGRDNVYEVTVVAADDQGLADSVAVTVTVTDLNEGPEVSGPQSLSLAENQAADEILATYGASDPEDPSGPITRWGLSGTDAGDFSVSEAGELSFRKAPDYERPADSNKDNAYSLSVRASDGRNYGYLAVTVTVDDVNEAPEITTTAKTAFAYRENGSAAVFTFSAADPEQSAVAWSAGGADSGDFAVTPDSRGRGVLSFADPPNFESPADAGRDNVYEVTVVATDDQGLTDTVAVTVTVTDHGEGPVVSGPQSLSFAENQATDEILATYGASDPEDPSGPITRWSLSGTDAGDFSVSDTGELSFRKAPDYERPADSNKDNAYSLSVRASDGRNYGYLAVTVTVENINEAPEITTTAKTVFAYRENGTAAVYTFSAADPEQAAVAWSAGGADRDDFAVTPDSRGRGVLSFANIPDFESPADADSDNVYEVTVVATDDQGLTDSVAVTVTVSDVNEGPEVSGPQSLSFTENQATDQILATYDAVDPENPSGPITRWSLSGTDAGDFAVSDTGELTFRKAPDYERPADSNKDNVYGLSVRASDGRSYGYLAVTVTVDDVNEAPEITTTAKTAFAYRENGTAAVYTFSAADPEQAAVVWSAGGADGGIFAVTRDSRGRGVLSFANIPDFESPADAGSDNVYEVTVVAADDQGLTDSVAVTVTVTDHGEGPVVSGRQSLSFTENQATDEILAAYGASDPEDPSGPITRWGLSGTDAGDFSVSDTGELSFRKAPDYERPADSNKDNVYSLSIRASDGRNYGYLTVTVTVDDVNEAPEITTTAKTVFAYRENGTAAVFTFSAADPERSAVAWSAGGADSGIFAVTRDSRGRGVLSFANIPDFESPADVGSDNVYEVTVEATDDQGLADSVAVTVTVSDVNEGPEVSGLQSLSFAENQATDRVLATYDAVDPEDPSGPITRWGLSGTDAGDFAVSEAGELSFRKVPDYERPADSNKDNVYSLSVRASDGRNYGYLAVTVTVTDVNEAPEITTTAKTVFAYRENGTAAVFTFSAADPEQSAVAWSAGGADSGIFAVTRDSRGRGVLSFANIPDFESPADAGRDNVYEVTVVATDNQGLTGTLAVTVTVTDLNEKPVVSGSQSLSFAENQATDQILATYDAVDPENPTGPITRWSLSGTDAGDFSVSDTGELTFRKAPDYEKPADSNKDNAYSLSIRASDGRNYGYLAVTVTITDINEAPDISGSDRIVFQENGTNSLAAYRATDQENGTISWNLSGTDSNAFTISDTGILAFANPPDYEQPTDSNRNNVYQVIVEATDPEANTALVQVTVTVTNQTD